MLGHKSREFKRQVAVSLEALVPLDNFYRQLHQCIDLSFVRELAEKFYSSFGRPSIDPVVLRWAEGQVYGRRTSLDPNKLP